MEKWLHSLPEPYFSCVTLSFLAADSKMELGLLLPCSPPKKRWWMGKGAVTSAWSFSSPTSSQIPLLGPQAAACLSWGQAGGSEGTKLGRRLGQHVSDVLLWVLGKYPFPGNFPRGAEQAEKGEKGRDYERSVH